MKTLCAWRTAVGIISALVLVLVAWMATPSGFLVKPISWTYDRATGLAMLESDVRWPGVRARRNTVIAGCVHAETVWLDGTVHHEAYLVPPAVRACAVPGAPVEVTLSVLVLWGAVPLRPVRLESAL